MLFDVDGTLLLTHDEIYVEASRFALETVYGIYAEGPDVPGDTASAHIRRALRIVDVPEEEYDSLGCNVVAIAPRNVIMVRGNPATRSRLESAGCQVSEFDGSEICLPGAGGPTCLTRPFLRA